MTVSAAPAPVDLFPSGLVIWQHRIWRGGQPLFACLEQSNTVHSLLVLASWGDILAPFLPLFICNFLITQHEKFGFILFERFGNLYSN